MSGLNSFKNKLWKNKQKHRKILKKQRRNLTEMSLDIKRILIGEWKLNEWISKTKSKQVKKSRKKLLSPTKREKIK